MRHYRELAIVALGASLLSGCGLSSSAPRETSSQATKNEASPSLTTSRPRRQRLHPSQSPQKVTASTLPKAFPRYSLVVSTVGRLLAQSAKVPVYLPQLGAAYNHTSINVLYGLKDGGYQLSLGGGPPLPANSPKIGFGNAEYIYTVIGLPWSSAFRAQYLPLNPKPATVEYGPVILAPGISARSYPAAYPPTPELQETMLIAWREDGWSLSLYGIGIPSQAVVGSARQVARSLRGKHLPGTHGRATFAIGSDLPSMATYDLYGTRYVIETTSFRAAQFASEMTPVRP